VTYRPGSGQYMPESACEDLREKRRAGWLLGANADGPLEVVDSLGETPEGNDPGIEVYRHPDMLRLEHPELANLVDRFQVGALRKLTSRAYETLSAFETTCLLTMQAAHAREQEREIERIRTKGEKP
jgi:hypothetical protein